MWGKLPTTTAIRAGGHPDHLFYQTLALLHRPQHWNDPAAIRAELELEAFREHHVRNILAMLSANQVLIGKYLDGTLDKSDDAPEEEERECRTLAPEQRRSKTEILQSVQDGHAEGQKREAYWQGDRDGGAPDQQQRASPESRTSPSGGHGLGPHGSIGQSRDWPRLARPVATAAKPGRAR